MTDELADGRLNRRGFLGRGAALAAAGGLAAGCRSDDDPLLAEYPDLPENRAALPPNGRHVVIIGAGLSGLMAACELLDRGFRVTILEKNATPGGRLRAWRDREFGTPRPEADWPGYPIEHGTHIILGFYNNFREFLGRHGLRVRDRSINDPLPAISFAYPDGTIDDRHESRLPAPLHGHALLRGLTALSAEEDAQIGIRQALKVAAFNATDPAEVAYLDGISLADWARAVGFPEASIGALFDPVMDMANFHLSEQTSALYLHRFVGAMMGHWRDLYRVHFFQDSTQETIIEPLQRYIEARGGVIRFNAEVDEIVVADGRVSRVRAKPPEPWAFVCPICGEVHEFEPERCRRCGWAGGGFRPQAAGPVEVDADWALLAVDIPGAQRLFRAPPFADEPFFAPVQKLPTSSIAVLYLWYPRLAGKGRWHDHFGERECLMTSGFATLGTTLNLTLLKAPSYGESGADVIETQIARIDAIEGLGEAEIAARVDADLRALIPDLPPFADHRLMRWDNFSTMTVGAEANRPDMFTPIDNFLILGDFNRLEHNCILMEKVTVNVRRAVNHMLDREGIAGGRLTILPSETPNPLVRLARRTCSVKA